ncbi:MAG: hypothetical protein KC731_27385 [Myxococcales bacterium]|nr:hypothetical protein [Myxococcales bacterium]
MGRRGLGARLGAFGAVLTATLVLAASCAKDRFDEEALEVEKPVYEPSAESTEEACSDGMDNDGDGWIDCVDLDCQPGPPVQLQACLPDGMPEDTDDRCSDGIDNDENGFTDCQDFDCDFSARCPKENTAELCSDGVSNDSDPYVDCDDFDCSDFCP